MPGTVKPPRRNTWTSPCCPASSCKVPGEAPTTSLASASGEAGSGTHERLKVAVVLPVLVTVSGTVLAGEPGPTQPNDTIEGTTVAPGARAAAAFSLPAPTEVINGSTELELSAMSLASMLAVLTKADLICAAEKPGFACFTSAAAPATMAAAKLDPSTVATDSWRRTRTIWFVSGMNDTS